MAHTELKTLINQSTRLQRYLFRGIAIVLWLGAVGVGMAILLLPNSESDQDAIRFIMGFIVAFILVGIYCWWLGEKLPKKVLNLIKHPDDIAEVSHVQARKNGIVAHGVRFKTKDNKTIGLNVANGQTAERIVMLVQDELLG